MELKLDGLAGLLQGQSEAWILAVAVLVLSIAVLVLCIKVRGGGRR